jgi:hypothetical protein
MARVRSSGWGTGHSRRVPRHIAVAGGAAVCALVLTVLLQRPAVAESYEVPLACGMPTVRLTNAGAADRHLPAMSIAGHRHPAEGYYDQASALAAEFVAELKKRNPGKQAQVDRARHDIVDPIALGLAGGCALVEILAYAERYRDALALTQLQALAETYDKAKRMKRPVVIAAADAAKLDEFDRQTAAVLRPWPPLAKAVLWADIPPRLKPFGLRWQ